MRLILSLVVLCSLRVFAGANVLVYTDNPAADAVRSIQAMTQTTILGPGEPAPEVVGGEATLVLVSDPKNIKNFDLAQLEALARNGGLVIMGLEEYAALNKLPVSTTETPNPQHVKLDLKDQQQVDAYGKTYDYWWNKGQPLTEEAKAIQASLLEEIRETVPGLETLAEDPALTGYPIGSVIPWCSEGKVYLQQQLEGKLPAGTKVLARSTINGRPVFVRQDLGRGKIYALCLRPLPEPRVLSWEARGGFNKLLILQNLISRPVIGGKYWNQRPTYPEYAEALRKLAARCPAWKFEQIGVSMLGDKEFEKIYSFRMGDPAQPMYVLIGMCHAEDEWIPALGAYSFIEYLQAHKDDPEIKAVLQKHSIRVLPFLHPQYYESVHYRPKQVRPSDKLNLDITRNDNVYACIQYHQGGSNNHFVTACGTPASAAMEIARKVWPQAEGRWIWWQTGRLIGKGPEFMPISSEDPSRPPKPVHRGPEPGWDGYWVQDKLSCYGVYPIEVMMKAKALFFLEHAMIGFMPDEFTLSGPHHWAHRSVGEGPAYTSLFQSDQTVAYSLAFIQTEFPPETCREPNWSPDARFKKMW